MFIPFIDGCYMPELAASRLFLLWDNAQQNRKLPGSSRKTLLLL
jgi:hypothetical protein